MEATLLIMAAGIGSRYGGSKQTDGFGPNGELLVDYFIFDALQAGFNKIVFVIRKHMEHKFEYKFGDKLKGKAKVIYAYQEYDSLPETFAPLAIEDVGPAFTRQESFPLNLPLTIT